MVFVVAGYLAAGPGRFSSLILGQYDKRGKLAYAGLVGTGLSEDTRRAMLAEMQTAARKTCPFAVVPVLRDHFGELRTDPPPQ